MRRGVKTLYGVIIHFSLKTIPLYAKDIDFEKGPFSYALRSNYDKELIKRHKK